MFGPALRPTRADFAALLRLALPIVVVQVGMMAMGVVDTMMVGHVSPQALAAAALGNLFSWGLASFGTGVLMVLDPVIAQARGARDEQAIALGIQRGFVLAAVLSVPTALAHLGAGPFFRLLQQPADVIPLATGYVYRVIPGVFPFLAFVVLRQTLQAFHRTRPIVATIVAANLANAALNYLFIFGKLGFPAMGVLGSAWATTLSRWWMGLALLVLAWPQVGAYLRHEVPGVFRRRPLWRLVEVGVPIGGQMILEMGAFGSIALLMGWLGTIQIAAHQVAINMAALTFMVPVGVASAGAVLVGHAVGQADPNGVRRSSLAALATGAGFMSLTAVSFLTFPGALASLYSNDATVLALAATLIPIAGVFQVFDGLQAVSMGLLRGLGDTRAPMWVSVLGFWCVGLPVSLLLGFGAHLGARGLWWGFVAGLGAVAIVLLVRLRRLAGGNIARLQIDEHTGPHPVPFVTPEAPTPSEPAL